MKLSALSVLLCLVLKLDAQTLYIANWPLHDTAKAVSFYTELNLRADASLIKNGYAGISTEGINLTVERNKKRKPEIVMTIASANAIASGLNVKHDKKKGLVFPLVADTGTYRLLLTRAYDSAQNFSLITGYAYLPYLDKWKLIGTVKQPGYGFLKEVATVHSVGKKQILGDFRNMAVLRSNNMARTVDGLPATVSAVYWRGEPDSMQRAAIEKATIESAIIQKRTPALQSHEGLYYFINNKGTGRAVKVTDTLTVYYRGNVLGDTAVFDQTKPGSPARFPLNNLILGWKIGLPLVNEGGKITLVIPSGLAYSIRTRSPKIPPNSILVFDIEVVKAEPAL